MGEPLVSAAGILGVMAIWRTYYAAFLDWRPFLSFDAARDAGPEEAARAWGETITAVLLLTVACGGGAAALHFAAVSGPPS